MNSEEKQRNYELAGTLISEQNFAAAVVAGAVATLLAATAYGITVAVFCAVFLSRRSLSRAERVAIGLFELRG